MSTAEVYQFLDCGAIGNCDIHSDLDPGGVLLGSGESGEFRLANEQTPSSPSTRPSPGRRSRSWLLRMALGSRTTPANPDPHSVAAQHRPRRGFRVDGVGLALAPPGLTVRAAHLDQVQSPRSEVSRQSSAPRAGAFHTDRQHFTERTQPTCELSIAGPGRRTVAVSRRRPSSSSTAATCRSLCVSTRRSLVGIRSRRNRRDLSSLCCRLFCLTMGGGRQQPGGWTGQGAGLMRRRLFGHTFARPVACRSQDCAHRADTSVHGHANGLADQPVKPDEHNPTTTTNSRSRRI